MVSRAMFEKLRKAAERQREFRSPEAARAWFRKWRDGLIAKAMRAAARDGVAVDWSLESIKALESWAVGVGPLNARGRTGLSAAELHGAVRLYADTIAVRDYGCEWAVMIDVVATAKRHCFVVRRASGCHHIEATDIEQYRYESFWNQDKDENTFYDNALSERESFLRGGLAKVTPHRARLSPELGRRRAEGRMLETGLDPWSEAEVLAAFLRKDDPRLHTWDLAEILRDPGMCGEATLAAMRAYFESNPTGWRAMVLEIMVRHGAPDTGELCKRCLRDDSPRNDLRALGILTWLRERSAIGDVVAWMTEFTRRKRRYCEALHFFHAAAYLRTYGVRTRVVRDVLALMDTRRSRLSAAEQAALATVTGAFRGPTLAERRAAGLGKPLPVIPIATMRRMLVRVPRPPRELGFVD